MFGENYLNLNIQNKACIILKSVYNTINGMDLKYFNQNYFS